jgi:flagellum-specific peptidoglycan hydrolase FlgJ
LFSQADYFKKYQKIADSLGKEYKIPSCLILGVGYLESGGGKSKIAKVLNNHFGIVGKNNLYNNGNFKSKYKYYKSVTDSYIGFCNLVASKTYYSELKGNTNIEKWANAIASKGYAKNADAWSNYVIKLTSKQCLDYTSK